MAEAPPGVREARTGDRAAWIEMWNQFVGAKPSEPGDADMAVLNWSRIAEPAHPLRCIVAVDERDVPQGFTLFATFPFTWSRGEVCYLEDIFVRESARGHGHARAMIERLAAIGREQGWFKIFWMTEADNHRAQRLYETVAKRMSYIRYDLPLG